MSSIPSLAAWVREHCPPLVHDRVGRISGREWVRISGTDRLIRELIGDKR
jgi:hypothetical protein